MILRSLRNPAIGTLLAAIALFVGSPDVRARASVEDLQVQRTESGVLVSYRVADGLTAETLERIHSGIPVGFRHKIEVRLRRGILLPAKIVARVIVRTRVGYDSLTQRYQLYRRTETRSRDKQVEPAAVEEERVTESRDEMTTWMTRFDGVPVVDPTQKLPRSELRVRVEVSLGRRYVLWIFPSNLEASAELRLAAES